MRKKIDFVLNLIPLECGAYNFLLTARPGCRGYFSPLASYISPERAIRQAREHAARIVQRYGGTIGSIQITRDRSDGSDQSRESR